MNKTKIEWVKNPDGTQGYTWNPLTGCNNQIDGLCGGRFPCYAYRLANTRLRDRYLANKNTATQNYDEDSYPFYPRFWEDRLVGGFAELQHAKPRGIFICDMSDLFGTGVPRQWTEAVMHTIKKLPQHRFYLLTKQPQNLIKFSPFPDNCWVGVSATNSEMMYWAVERLSEIKANVKYLSLEPLLDWKSPKLWLSNPFETFLKWGSINQIIIGAQTKPYRPPRIEWVQEIVEASDKSGIPVFLKNNLLPLFQPLMRVPNLSWWGNVFGLRQELPK